METMSPQQQQESLSRSRTLAGEAKISGQYENKRRMKSLSHRRRSAPSLVISKALTRSRTVSRENFLVPLCPETCSLVESFLTPGRMFLLHGHAQLKTGLQEQDRHLFLFTDILVIAKAKSPTHFKLKAQAFVCEMWTAGCMEEVCEGSTSPERSFVMGWPTCNCVATFSFVEQKERWLSLLKSRVKEEKEKDDPKTIPLRVYGKGIGNCSLEKTLPVSNSDSTNEVVRLALQQFGSTGCVKDYQLWVSSKRENAPYPLIGHEFPFSIHMSHEREPLSQSGGGRGAVPPPDRQRTGHTEQMQLLANKQCQFILKPRCLATMPQPVIADAPQKPFKRRRSLINWAFWRGSNPQLHDLSSALSCPAPGYLFGQSLSSVCLEDALPKPVMDMLVFLYHEGSFTRGIFRRSAGARACREFRDRIDYGGQDLPFTREHIFIVAAVFKDFLRNIPGSLLCSDLYEEWMDVMEEADGGEEEQAQVLQRLIGRLPKENALLLRYVVAVLHGIQGNAHDNQMNAFNLSVCIAPSMLWAPGPSSPEVEGEGAKKVCDLVRFMIEHCQQVLGEDVTSLFGGPPQKGTVSEHESDVSTFNLTDSSYDSLENELNEDSSEFPGRRRRGRRRVKARQGSLDSVLTLSDYDLDHPEIDTDPNTTTQPGKHSPRGGNTIPLSGNPNHHFLQLPALARPRTRRRSPAAPARSGASPTPATRGGTKASHPPLSLGGRRRQRRSSEPTIGLSAAGFVAHLVGNVERMGSFEDLSGGDDEEEVYKGGSVHTASGSRGACEGSGLSGATSLLLSASYSSLSSPPNSPTPTRSSLDSLDSLLSPPTDHRNLSWHPSAKLPPSSAPILYPSSASLNLSISTPGPPASTHSPGPAPAPAPAQEPCPKSAPPPKEALSWGTLKSSRGLHPNTWLKRGRRLSLQQQDNPEREEESGVMRSNDKTLPASKSVQEKAGVVRQASADLTLPSLVISPSKGGGQERGGVSQEQGPLPPRQGKVSPLSKQRSLGHIQYCRSPSSQSSERPLTVRELREIHNNACLLHRHGTAGSDVTTQGRVAGSDACEPKRPSQGVSYGQSGPSLSLYRQKSHSLTSATEGLHVGELSQRRASEPAVVHLAEALALERVSTLHMEGLPREAKQGQSLKGDPGVSVSDVEPQCGQSGQSTESRFCLSPSVTETMKDYILSPRHSNPQSSQRVALALAQGKRERLRRCSDPMLEPDFDKLLFAEESYV